jgi:Metallo-peptidase family M12B Reprolysin-like
VTHLNRLLGTFNLQLLQRRAKKLNRTPRFELMEKRYAFSADLLQVGMGFDEHADDHHYDGSGFELHVLTELPNQADPVNPQNTLSTITPVVLADTFKLHSNPGAKHRIFLDFDGHVTSGTIWNSNYRSGLDIVTPSFDLDGNVASFSDPERQRIQLIWERVSEDFIPFNVDVTTEDPGAAALTKSGSPDEEWGIRIVIGGSSSDWWGSPVGGLAYIGSFNWSSDTPGFVFPAQLGSGNEKYTAEAISHEVGHALGLNHDGRSSPVEEYFAGHGAAETSWAPIMGSSYYKNVTQWSKGEYAYASQTEDDLTIISTQNGFSYRNDDHGNSNATASLMDISGSIISDWGIIERTTDADYFSFATGAGTIQIDVKPLDRGPNLDIFLELYDASNVLLASSNPLDLLSASITATVSAQQYYLRVSGTGKGSAATDGFSRYASLGQFFISGTVVPVQNDFLSVMAESASKPEGNSASTAYTFVVSRTGNTSGTSSVNYSVFGSGANPTDAGDFASGSLPSGSISFAAGEVTKTVTIHIAGDTLVESDEGFTLSLSNPSGETVVVGSSANGLNLNDDLLPAIGVTVTPTSGLITKESRTTASFTAVLKSQPTSDVTIQVTSMDLTEGIVNTSQLRFTSANWNVAQTVTITGVDDTIRDGNITYWIDLASAVSNDSRYNGVQVDNVQVTNQDNEKSSGAKRGLAVDYLMAPVTISESNNLAGTSQVRVSESPTQIQRDSVPGRVFVGQDQTANPADLQCDLLDRAAASAEHRSEAALESFGVNLNALDAVFSDFQLT